MQPAFCLPDAGCSKRHEHPRQAEKRHQRQSGASDQAGDFAVLHSLLMTSLQASKASCKRSPRCTDVAEVSVGLVEAIVVIAGFPIELWPFQPVGVIASAVPRSTRLSLNSISQRHFTASKNCSLLY